MSRRSSTVACADSGGIGGMSGPSNCTSSKRWKRVERVAMVDLTCQCVTIGRTAHGSDRRDDTAVRVVHRVPDQLLVLVEERRAGLHARPIS